MDIWLNMGFAWEWIKLTLNRFQMQFLFQKICFSYVWHHYNWQHVMGNCFLVNSLIILVNGFFDMSCYARISVKFFVDEKYLLTKDDRRCHQESSALHQNRISYTKLILFCNNDRFITKSQPRADRKEIQYSILGDEARKRQIALIITKIDGFLDIKIDL